MPFSSINPALSRALAARDYSVPTAVQLSVLAEEGRGRDLLVSAQTGSGKTVAFGLAMATTLLGEAERFGHAAEPLALIIAPTRELAMQVQRELDWLYAETGARVVTCVGGMDARTEARQLDRGAHIVVGTPGRLRDHLERKRLDLSKLKAVVLDEADEMLDLGFREDLEFILDTTPEERQTLLFSATMPRAIEALAKRYQRDAFRIQTIRSGEQHADIEYQAIRVAPADVENAVVNVLRYHEMRAALVFCATREAVKRFHSRLLDRGFAAVALSGELTQNERTAALQSLRDGRARVLVATDVAARGLDLPDLALVIHAELPNDRETLLHRSGRTGRAGKKGICTLIVPHHRRRKAEALIGAARVRVTWGDAPTIDEIRARDQERFLSDAVFTDTPARHDLAAAQILQSTRTADEIALALVRMHNARLPTASEIVPDRGAPARREDRVRGERGDRSERDGPRERRPSKYEREQAREAGGAPRERAPRGPRDDVRPMIWYRLNIGRERNADPRWVLPLICESGDITKAEIGSIKIFDRDTRFQVLAEVADKFDVAVRTGKNKQGHISRVRMASSADDAVVMGAIAALDGSGAPSAPSTPSGEDAAPAPALRSERPARDEHAPREARVERGPREARPERAPREPRSEHAPREARAKAPWRDRSKPGASRTPGDRGPAGDRSSRDGESRREGEAGNFRTSRSEGHRPYKGAPGGAPGRAPERGDKGKFPYKKKRPSGGAGPR